MEGNRLFYTIKLCDATNCVNNHVPKVEKIEKHIIAWFNYQLLANNLAPFVSPGPTYLSQATHIQYIDTDGTVHISPIERPPYNIVNFRLLAISRWANLFGSLEPCEVRIGCLLVAYNNHLIQ